MAEWIDLLDPGEDELRAHVGDVDPGTLEQLLAARIPKGARGRRSAARATTCSVSCSSAVLEPEEDRLYYQEIDLVVTRDRVVTVRKTPPGGEPFDPSKVEEICTIHPHLRRGRSSTTSWTRSRSAISICSTA